MQCCLNQTGEVNSYTRAWPHPSFRSCLTHCFTFLHHTCSHTPPLPVPAIAISQTSAQSAVKRSLWNVFRHLNVFISLSLAGVTSAHLTCTPHSLPTGPSQHQFLPKSCPIMLNVSFRGNKSSFFIWLHVLNSSECQIIEFIWRTIAFISLMQRFDPIIIILSHLRHKYKHWSGYYDPWVNSFSLLSRSWLIFLQGLWKTSQKAYDIAQSGEKSIDNKMVLC